MSQASATFVAVLLGYDVLGLLCCRCSSFDNVCPGVVVRDVSGQDLVVVGGGSAGRDKSG